MREFDSHLTGFAHVVSSSCSELQLLKSFYERAYNHL